MLSYSKIASKKSHLQENENNSNEYFPGVCLSIPHSFIINS